VLCRVSGDGALLDVAVKTLGKEQALAVLGSGGDDGQDLHTGVKTGQIV